MELLVAALAVVQLVVVGVTIRAFIVTSRRNDTDRVHVEDIARLTQDGFDHVADDIESVVGVRDSMDQEIRERQAAYDTVVRLVGRQGRAIAEHIESNLHG